MLDAMNKTTPDDLLDHSADPVLAADGGLLASNTHTQECKPNEPDDDTKKLRAA